MKDEYTCPICGKSNQCQAKTDPENCWCKNTSVDYSKLRQQLGENREQCLCPGCLAAFKQVSTSQ